MSDLPVQPVTAGSAVPATSDYLSMMKSIAEDTHTSEDVRLLASDRVTDQLKVFLVAQARNELKRIIRLTEVLDNLESSFIDKVNTSVSNDEVTLKQYGEIINLIVSLLTRSNEIVSSVLKDDSLTIFNTTVFSNTVPGVGSQSIITQLQDVHSREKVRLIIQKVLNRADDYVEINESEITNEGDEINEEDTQ